MNPGSPVQAKLSAAPLDFRLALTFSPAERRAALGALLAVYFEIREIPLECRDPGVAEVKLRWWEEEIGELYAGKPRHPVSVALHPHLTPLAGKQTVFLDLVSGTRLDVAMPGFASFEDLKRYCYRHSGALAELSALLAGARSETALLSARLLGNSTRLADIAARGTAEALHGRVYFAVEDLKKHGVDRHISGETHGDGPVKALVQDYAVRSKAMRDEALAGLPDAEIRALTLWRVLSALALKRAAKSRSPAAEPVELHPLSALFTTWRAARG
ncbi:MAG: squalene/phytoene synthase family protein [Bacillota bacterium]